MPFTIPYASDDDRITELILRAGDIRARRAEQGGDLWGSTVAGLGRMAGDALGNYQAQRKEEEQARIKKEQDDKFVSLVASGAPEDVYKGALMLYGPEGAKGPLEGYAAFLKIGEAAQDRSAKAKTEAVKQLGPLLGAMDGLDEENRAKLYPAIHSTLTVALPELMGGVSEQYDPEQWPMLSAVGMKLSSGEIKTRLVETRNADGSTTARIVPDAPGQEFTSAPAPDARGFDARIADAQARGDMGAVQELLALKQRSAAAERGPQQPNAGAHSWVMRNGQPLRVSEGEIQPGDTPYESARTGAKRMPAGEAVALADMQTGLDQSAVLRTKLAGGTAGVVSRVGAAVDKVLPGITKATGWGQDAQNQQAVISLVKQIIGKSLEGGVLRKEDEIKYAHMIPLISDSDETVKAKLDTMDRAIMTKRDNAMSALSDAGYDTSAFEQRLGGVSADEASLLKDYGF